MEALHVFNIERRRQIINNSVEQWLNALVLKRRTAADRNKRLIQRALADQRLQRCNVWLITFKICFHGDIVLLNGKFDQFAAIFRRFRSQISRDIFVEEVRTKRFIFPDDCAVVHKVNQTLQIGFKADWDVQNCRLRPQTINDRLHAIFEVRTGAVKLIDEAHARNAILIGLTPYSF